MFISILIIIILAIAYLKGAHWGFVQMLVRLLGLAIVLLLAQNFAGILNALVNKFWLLIDQQTLITEHFSYWICYALIVICGLLILKKITRVFGWLTKLPLVHGLNAFGGGVAGIFIGLVLVFVGLKLLEFWPNSTVTLATQNSWLAQQILKHVALILERFSLV
jgi:hypothetical protein